MLRYIERNGLIEPQRSVAGYRLYGAAELQRLRTLKELLGDYDLGLGDIGFALRLRREQPLRDAVEAWFEAKPQRPADVPDDDWLSFEQQKHSKLLAAVRSRQPQPTPETA
jgi:DNA-binding transcriptional MerR regulator